MYDVRILASKVGLALIVALTLIGLARLLPASAQQGFYSAVGVVIAAVGASVANDLQTYKASKGENKE